jgi:hypothetical protein
MRDGMKLDTSEFDRRVRELRTRVLPQTQHAMVHDGLMALAEDTLRLPPVAPQRLGRLRGSLTLFVDGKRIATGARWGFDDRWAAKTHKPKAREGEVVGTIGFNAFYSRWLHENRTGGTNRALTHGGAAHRRRGARTGFRFRMAGAGPKWLQAKLPQSRKYGAKMAKRLRRRLNRKGTAG